MAQIGEPRRVIISEPIFSPVPQKEPMSEPAPQVQPEPEEVPADV